MRLIIVDLDANGDGVDFWKHARYRLKIDNQVLLHGSTAYDVLERIEQEMKARSYIVRSNLQGHDSS
jgi:hypothetical protein